MNRERAHELWELTGDIIEVHMKFNHTAHRQLWNWLADNPWANKGDWPGWVTFDNPMENDCFACEYVKDVPIANKCNCPLIWPENYTKDANDCVGALGMYNVWNNCDFSEHRSDLARAIANLPVREGVECI